jgi:aldehyde dehydrogenase (NAD+)
MENAVYLKANAPEAAQAGKTVIGFNLIHGREVEGDLAMTQTRSAVDRRDLVGIFPESGEKDVARAARAAGEAFQDWSRTPRAERIRLLLAGMAHLELHRDQLARIITREIGLTATEALAEVQAVIALCRALAIQPPSGAVLAPPKGLQAHQRPLGVVALLATGSSPLAAPAAALLPALLAGNTLVWKPSCLAPTTAYLFLRALQEAGLPPGVINTLNGRGRAATGRYFLGGLEKGLFQSLAFLGSETVGRLAAVAAGQGLVPVHLALGAGNAMLLMPDADLDLAVQEAIQGAFTRGGQCATHLGNLIVHEACLDEVRQNLLDRLAELKVGNPLTHPEVAFGPMAHARFADAMRARWEANELEGAESLCGGAIWTDQNREVRVLGDIAHGTYLQPTVWEGVNPDLAAYHQEAFGPSLNLCVARDFDEALALANGATTSRACSLYSQNPAWIGRFQEESRAALVGLNALPGPTDPWLLPQIPSAACPTGAASWQRLHGLATAAAETHPTKPLPPTDWADL